MRHSSSKHHQDASYEARMHATWRYDTECGLAAVGETKHKRSTRKNKEEQSSRVADCSEAMQEESYGRSVNLNDECDVSRQSSNNGQLRSR